MNNSPLIDSLLRHNGEQSAMFSEPGAVLLRRQYRARHPTEIAALKCMDGRLHLPLMTGIPLGIIQPFRNIGGKFDLGWPFFGVLLKDWVDFAISMGRDALVLVTYHYSKGDKYRGCKGFNYETEAAKSAAFVLQRQIEHVFGQDHGAVYPIVVGIETDDDALVIHGTDGQVLELARLDSCDEDLLRRKLHELFPDMKRRVILDFLPLLVGNMEHIKEVRSLKRTPVDLDHKEQILGIGRGFDWLHLHNKALLIGPFSFDLAEPVAKAAGILLENIRNAEEQGIFDSTEGVVLVASAVYRDSVGPEPRLAAEKANSLARFALNVIRTQVPDLLPHLSVLVGTVDMNTRVFTRQEFFDEAR